MTDGSNSERDLAALFQSITGRSTITERQQVSVPVRTLDETGTDTTTVTMEDGLADAIGNGGPEPATLDE